MPNPGRVPSISSLIDRATAVLDKVGPADADSMSEGAEKYFGIKVESVGYVTIVLENGNAGTEAGSIHFQRDKDDIPGSDSESVEARMLSFAIGMDLMIIHADRSVAPRDPDTLTRVGIILAMAEKVLGIT